MDGKPEMLGSLSHFEPALPQPSAEGIADYYNMARPHQGLAQQIPIPRSPPQKGSVHCRDVLEGVLHNYYRDVA